MVFMKIKHNKLTESQKNSSKLDTSRTPVTRYGLALWMGASALLGGLVGHEIGTPNNSPPPIRAERMSPAENILANIKEKQPIDYFPGVLKVVDSNNVPKAVLNPIMVLRPGLKLGQKQELLSDYDYFGLVSTKDPETGKILSTEVRKFSAGSKGTNTSLGNIKPFDDDIHQAIILPFAHRGADPVEGLFTSPDTLGGVDFSTADLEPIGDAVYMAQTEDDDSHRLTGQPIGMVLEPSAK